MVRLNCLIKLKYVALEPATFILNVEPTQAQPGHQRVVREQVDILGDTDVVERSLATEGTRLLRFEATGPVEIVSRFTVDIDHHTPPAEALIELRPRYLPLDVLPYLLPSRYCESDTLMVEARQRFGAMPSGYGRVAAIAEWVRTSVAFRSGTSHSQTSAVDILRQREGVCRDFAHLMIALCRALNIPARFVTGIDYGADPALGPPDFHAYVEVFLSQRWYLFDPTGISPTTGLVRLGTGRDASEAAFATIFGQVTSWAPYLEVEAVADASRGIELPQRTEQPVSTAGATIA